MSDFSTEPVDRPIVLLGPQPEYRSLCAAVERGGLRGGLACITAGWEEAEAEDGGLRAAVGLPIENLRLFSRSEALFAADPQILELLQRRQDELRHLRDVYRMRIGLAMSAAQKTLEYASSLVDLTPEADAAVEMVRAIDRQYFLRTCQICDRYEDWLRVTERESIADHRREIQPILESAEALLIAGGHSAVLLNRLNLFSILELRPDLPIFAWSGGAMALAEQIVFFHDRLPQGDTNPEVLRAGSGILDDVLPFPDAAHRLRLDDTRRMSLLARRFTDHRCVLLDADDWLERRGGGWFAGPQTLRLARDGQRREFAA